MPNAVNNLPKNPHKSQAIPRKGLVQGGDGNVVSNINNYRHGQYKIIEFFGGDLYWQCHYGFGSYREGRCYVKGEILFFGSAENEGLGFLIGEFIDSIKRLPPWTKTSLFCDHSAIIDCGTDKRVSVNEMRSWANYSNREGMNTDCKNDNLSHSDIGHLKSSPHGGFYRLGNYELTVTDNNLISWTLPIGSNSISSGNGLLVEDILFLGVANFKKQERGVKAQHIARLAGLPRWDGTRYYSRGFPPIVYCANHKVEMKLSPKQPMTSSSGTNCLAFLLIKMVPWYEVIVADIKGKPSLIAKTLLDFLLLIFRGLLSKSFSAVLAIWDKIKKHKR